MVVAGHLPDEAQQDRIGRDQLRYDDRHVRLGQPNQPHTVRFFPGIIGQEADDQRHRTVKHDRLDSDSRVAFPVGCAVRGQTVRRTGQGDDTVLHTHIRG